LNIILKKPKNFGSNFIRKASNINTQRQWD